VPVEQQIQPEDEAFLFIAPSAVEVAQVEKLYEVAGSRPLFCSIPAWKMCQSLALAMQGGNCAIASSARDPATISDP